MKRITVFHFKDLWRRLLAVVITVNMVAALAPVGSVSAEESGAVSGFTVQINETVTNGFTHPGVGVTKAVLENMRTQVLAQKEPWYSYYKAMIVSSAASKTVTSSNQSSTDPSKPASDAFNSQSFNSRIYFRWAESVYTGLVVLYNERRDLSGQCDAYHPHLGADGSGQIPIFHRCAYPCRHPAQPDDDGGGDFAVFDLSNTGACVDGQGYCGPHEQPDQSGDPDVRIRQQLVHEPEQLCADGRDGGLYIHR